MPPKESIREIRINQNPFSAEFDRLGFGRIEILTKPGTDKLRGSLMLMDGDGVFNSRNPFSTNKPDFSTRMWAGNVGGSISKKASFFVSAQHRNINDVQVVDANPFDPTTRTFPQFVQAIPDNMTRTNVSPRLDYQLGKNDTLTVRYQYWRNN